MKKLFYTLFISSVVLASCTKQDPIDTNLLGQWKASTVSSVYIKFYSENYFVHSLYGDQEYSAKDSLLKLRGSSFSDLRGDYTYSIKGNSLSFSSVNGKNIYLPSETWIKQ